MRLACMTAGQTRFPFASERPRPASRRLMHSTCIPGGRTGPRERDRRHAVALIVASPPPTATPTSDIVERRVHVPGDPETVFRSLDGTRPRDEVDGPERDARGRAGWAVPRRLQRRRRGCRHSRLGRSSASPRVHVGLGGVGQSMRPGGSRVEVSFAPEPDGTVVTVRHLDLPADARQSHAEGWDQFLPRLADALRAS